MSCKGMIRKNSKKIMDLGLKPPQQKEYPLYCFVMIVVISTNTNIPALAQTFCQVFDSRFHAVTAHTHTHTLGVPSLAAPPLVVCLHEFVIGVLVIHLSSWCSLLASFETNIIFPQHHQDEGAHVIIIIAILPAM